MAAEYPRGRTGAAARAKALGRLARPEDAPAGDELLDLLDEVEREFRWGAVWTRRGIDSRTRATLALAMAVATKCPSDALGMHVRMCVAAGLSKIEIGEILLHVYTYAGAYAARSGFLAAKQVFDELEATRTAPRRRRARGPTTRTVAGRTAHGDRIRRELLGEGFIATEHPPPTAFVSMFNDLTHEFCFGNIWARPALEWRTRSQMTLAIAAATHQVGAINRHVRIALRLGISRRRIGEIFLLAYPYAGAYPSFAAFGAAHQAFTEIDRERRTRKGRR